MPNANYVKGRNGEYATRNTLRGRGWVAERTAASHGPWDVMAVSPKFVLLIQVKTGQRPSPSDYKSIIDLPVGPSVLKLSLWYPDGARAARILYCADMTGPVAPPEWMAEVRWFEGEPPKIQLSLNMPKPRQKRQKAVPTPSAQ